MNVAKFYRKYRLCQGSNKMGRVGVAERTKTFRKKFID
ncbi:hypothetical protein [Citrobacter pasteurii]|nr:hypothetical protein SF123566_0654 [Shigella flexneri 1235-66]CEJ66236.1 hypothetical protein [Citrobacter pasteurii]